MSRTVFCRLDGCESPGLDFAPWPGELGQRVFNEIGQAAWQRWLAHQTLLINENRLSPRDPKTRAYLAEQMEKFLFGGGVADAAHGYVPPAN